MSLPDLVSLLVGGRVSLAVSQLPVFHVFAGLTCVVSGAVAIASPKQRPDPAKAVLTGVHKGYSGPAGTDEFRRPAPSHPPLFAPASNGGRRCAR